ncbi:cobaltochelatase CobT-related protein [Ancylobacter rudongensis]|uniref:Cobalamin biosynthesis protein CobT n=1 Tax=Ancylobacter rudongensis TaxID=177413 RepID=A0A1G4US21_9HYPH|nr:hypothetical protein [Ancylobacter rudongensis]SCW95755.1 Cobalamin biosynthesis protein CobT [Ancylobacter rudongensis]
MNREIIELREVIQKLVPLLTNRGLKVTQRGSQAFVLTDLRTRQPVSVNIPSVGDGASPEFIRAIQGFIDHEVAHVLITDWNYYGGGPTPQEAKDPKVRAFQNTHNIVEDTMIEREIVKIFPGSERNISDTRKFFLERITSEALKTAKNEQEAFIYLLVPAMRALAGHVEMEDYMDRGGHWKNPLVDNLVNSLKPSTLAALKTCSSTKETLEIAREVHEILYPPAPPAPPAPAPSPEKGDGEDKPDDTAGPGEGDKERKHEEAGDDGEGEAAPDAENGEDEDKPEDAEGSEDEEAEAAGTEDDDDSEDAEEEAPQSAAPEGEDEDEESKDDAGDQDDDGRDGDSGKDGESQEKDDAGESGKSSAGDDADDDAEDGAVGGAEGDEDGEDQADGSGASGDDEGGEGGAGGAGENEDGEQSDDSSAGSTPQVITAGADGGGVGEIETADESDDKKGGGGGVGNAAGKSMFEFKDDAFEGQDLSAQIAVLISEEAVEALDRDHYTVFTRELDKIAPLVPPEKINDRWIPDMEDEVRSMTSRMQKDIERLMAAQSYIIRTPGHRAGKLHAPSLYRVPQGDGRVFSQREEHKSKDTAVMLLIDNSGSMKGQKMRLAMMAGYALSTTLERVSIAHEVIGFTTGDYYGIPSSLQEAMQEDARKSGVRWDRMLPIVMPVYKEFDERVTPLVKKRIAYSMNAQNGLQGNIDGESLEYAAMRLIKRREKRKVMLVLSDGQPAGSNHAGPHLKYVVQNLTKIGIETIGIGIMDRAVERYYPKSVVLNNVSELPNEVMGALKKILQ